MNRTLAGTELSPSAVHAVIEIGASGESSAKALCDELLLEKSTISRLVKSLQRKGLVRELRSERDTRVKRLRLTRQGRQTLAAISDYAEAQVTAAVSRLGADARRQVLTGLQAYAAALRACRTGGDTSVDRGRATIKTGYAPGLVGRIVEMHACYYGRLVGFGVAFESKVAAELAAFVTRLDGPLNAIWHVECDGAIVGSIAIDGDGLGQGKAQLRWFILADEMQGRGLGQALMDRAMDHCNRQGFAEIHLWTIDGLDAARRLYERSGFVLRAEHIGDTWGTEILEQAFVKLRPGGSSTACS